MIIGKQVTDIESSNVDFEVNTDVLLKTHTFTQGMTGSGKTNLILEITDNLVKERPEVQLIYIDEQEEFTMIPERYSNVIMISKERTPRVLTVDHAFELGVQTRRKGQSLVLNLAGFKDKEKYVKEFLEGFWSDRKEIGTPCLLVIDEADIFVPTRSKRKNAVARDIIVEYAKRARKLNISLILATQFSSSVDIDARREMENFFIGRTKERRDRNAVCEMLGDSSIFDNLGWGLKKGQFYVRGDALSQDLKLIQTKESKIEKKLAGVHNEESLTDLSGIYESSVVDHNDMTMLEMLRQKLDEMEKELRIAKSKELTDDIRKSLIDMGYNEGLVKARKEFEEGKSKVSRFFRSAP